MGGKESLGVERTILRKGKLCSKKNGTEFCARG